MFKKSTGNQGTRERVATGRPPQGENGITIIGPGMHIRGDLTTDGTVRIEGSIEGTIRAATAVVLGKNGRVNGDIFTNDAVIGGHLQGSVVAQSLELQATCHVEGQIRTRADHLKLEEGANFNGAIQMDDGREVQPIAAPTEEISPEFSTQA